MVKKTRPSFDVAREALDERRDGWAYRSDPPSPPPASHGEGAAASQAATSSRPSEAPATEKSRPGAGWLGAGLGMMTMPLALTIVAMIAPAIWISGWRARR